MSSLSNHIVSSGYVACTKDFFGPQEWQKYFGVKVESAEIPVQKIAAFFSANDAINPELKNYETHLPPVFRPQSVTHIGKDTLTAYNLHTLGQLIQNPIEGKPAQYQHRTEALIQNEHNMAGEPCWLIMRKEIFAREQSYQEQNRFIADLNTRTNIGYETQPSALDLATVITAHHVATGERYLNLSKESSVSSSRDVIRNDPVEVGYFSAPEEALGTPAKHDCLTIGSNTADPKDIGIAGLKKF